MAFLDNITKKVGDVASSAAKKSGELLETQKLNSNIGSEEDKIKNLYLEIGRTVYQKYSQNMLDHEDYRFLCDNIKEHENNITALREKIDQIKNS